LIYGALENYSSVTSMVERFLSVAVFACRSGDSDYGGNVMNADHTLSPPAR
jgi:hypothetical protein